MRIIHNLDEMTETARGWLSGGSVGFVPTEGHLHRGFITLIEAAQKECEISVVSIFANPFLLEQEDGNSSLLTVGDLTHDLQLLDKSQVDVVFIPRVEDIYPANFATFVVPDGQIAKRLERLSNVAYVRGVATNMTKLFQIVRPDIAYFEQKDALRVALIRQLVRDLNIDIGLRVLPSERDPDGLVTSKYNDLLTPQERSAASALYRALMAGKALIEGNVRDAASVVDAMENIITSEPLLKLDYAIVCHPDTFHEMEEIVPRAMLTIALHIRDISLMDNIIWLGGGHWLL